MKKFLLETHEEIKPNGDLYFTIRVTDPETNSNHMTDVFVSSEEISLYKQDFVRLKKKERFLQIIEEIIL